jgi:hypothetical protein
MVTCAPQSPGAPCSRAPMPDLLLGAGRRERPAVPGLPSGDPSRLRRELGELRPERLGMAARAKIAVFTPPPSTSDAGVCEGDFPAVP